MKIETAVKKVVEFLESNPTSTKEVIGTKTKVKGLELTNVLKALRKQERLVEDGEGKEATFSVKPEATPTTEEPVVEETEPVVTEKLKKGRNNDKYQFNGNAYGKGKLVLEVVRQFVNGHPKVNFKNLKEVFPDTLLNRFGIFQEESAARNLSGTRDRYFFQDEHQIKLSDKKVIVVCNQFTSDNIIPFLAAAKKAGFKIK